MKKQQTKITTNLKTKVLRQPATKFIADLKQIAEQYDYYEPDNIKSAEMYGRIEGIEEAITIFKKFYLLKKQ